MFEKVMYKVKDNVYRIRDFTSGDNVEESKFVEGTNQRGAPQMQAQVYVLFEDEYIDIKTKLDAHESEVQHFKALISERETQIMKLKKESKEKGQVNSEVMQLRDELSIMKEDHYKEVSKLRQEKSTLEKSHHKELEDLKETHANKLSAIDETHQKEIEDIRSQYTVKLDEGNDKLLSQVQSNKQSINKLKDEMLTMTKAHGEEIDKLHQEKSNLEIAHSNEMRELEKVHHDEVMQLNEDISQLKQEHLKEINKKEQSHNDEVETIRTSFLNLLTNVNAQDRTEIKEIKNDVPSIFKPFMRKTMKKLEELEERKQINAPEKIIKTYELSGE